MKKSDDLAQIMSLDRLPPSELDALDWLTQVLNVIEVEPDKDD